MAFLHFNTNGVCQVGFTKARIAVDHQRVECSPSGIL